MEVSTRRSGYLFSLFVGLSMEGQCDGICVLPSSHHPYRATPRRSSPFSGTDHQRVLTQLHMFFFLLFLFLFWDCLIKICVSGAILKWAGK